MREDPRDYRARAALARHPVRALLGPLGDPQTALSAVHIAGSKGKGSTALLLEALLQRAGLHTGTYTSPHLQRWTERIRIDGRDIPVDRFVEIIEGLRPRVAALLAQDPDTAPSFFDVLTAAAFAAFRDAGVDCAIVETGIGGRLDATNVLDPLVTCITSVELEHTDKLGGTFADIAREKAGIARPGVPLVTGPLPREAMEVIHDHAARIGAPLWRLGEDFQMATRDGGTGEILLEVRAGKMHLEVPVRGSTPPCMLQNAALALVLASLTGLVPAATLADAAREALPRIRLPGRLEILREDPCVVVDGAHTESSMRALAAMLDALPARRRHLVISITRGKDPARLLAPLTGRASRLWVTRADAERSMTADAVAKALQAAGFEELHTEPDPLRALEAAQAGLTRDDLLCVTGSMYMAGLAREHLAPETRSA